MTQTGWLQEFLASTIEAESPRSFFYWSGLAAISAAVRNRVWLPKPPPDGFYKLFPNLYILLIAPSGLRKGYPVAIAKQLVIKTDSTRIIGGRSSIQGIIKELSTARTSPTGGPPITDATGFIVSGEFSTSLVRDPDALTILTDLYDGHYNPEWKNSLKNSPVEELKNVNITLLGAMNLAHFNDLITDKEVEGGFIARCVIVKESVRSHKNALLRPVTRVPDVSGLSDYLKEISRLTGPFTVTEDAIKHFETWYNEFDPEGEDDKTGSANRIHDTILKVAMLLALSREAKLIIQECDIEEAMERCLGTVKGMEETIKGRGKSEIAEMARIFLADLMRRPDHKATRAAILAKHYGDFSSSELDKVVITLLQAGYIFETMIDNEGGYELKPAIIKFYEARKAEEKKI